jgi:predicted ATPase
MLTRVELIGRDGDLAEIGSRFASGRRLVTVVGPGGIGKTALARAALDLHGSELAAGRAVAELSRIDRPAAVPGAVAAALGFTTFDVLLDAPPEHPFLVLIDNCEHVTDAAADAIGRLLEAWTDVLVVATSRSPLGLTGESLVMLDPLAVPAVGALDARTAAVRLFCDRARDNGVEIGDHDLDAVVELCRRLDGMPLAIELAAARVRILGVADLARRVGQGVDLLARQRHRGDARHRSVHDTIVWSSHMLDDPDRDAFGRLSVCAGSLELETAAAVIGCSVDDALDPLERLVDASLVTVHRHGPVVRYRMLEPIRAVALDQLAEAGLLGATRERLAQHVYDDSVAMIDEAVVRWSAHLLPGLIGRFDQIDVAVRHCLDHDHDPTRALLLYAALWGVVHQSRVDDVLALGPAVFERWPDPAARHGADAAATYALALLLGGRMNEARAIAAGALPHTDASVMAAPNLRRVLAFVARAEGDRTLSESLLAEAAAVAAADGIVTIDLECRTYRAQDLAGLGRADEALEIVRTVAELAREHRSILNEVWARTVEASILAGTEDHDGAIEAAAATLLVSRAIAYPFGIICNLQTLAAGHLRTGDLAAAAETAAELLDAVDRSGSGDFRRALDIAAAVLDGAGHPGSAELSATAHRLPDTNPMTVHLPQVERPQEATNVLDRPSATRLARRALAEVQTAMTIGRSVTDVAVADTTETAEAAGTEKLARFVRSGDLWEVAWDALTVHVAATRGMDDLAVLLARPGREIHCLELAGARALESDTGNVIDARARQEYEARIRDLQDDIDEADADHDLARAERARAELDALVDHLTSALGFAGRSRRQGGTTERARSAVTHRIRTATRRIAAAHPALGRHLAVSVSTGTYCRYEPERPVTWTT